MEIHQARLIVKRLTSAKAFIYAPHRKQFLFDETSKTATKLKLYEKCFWKVEQALTRAPRLHLLPSVNSSINSPIMINNHSRHFPCKQNYETNNILFFELNSGKLSKG